MALKSIFEIEIDDSKFRNFKRLFDKYQSELKKLPPEWQKMNASINQTKSLVDHLVDLAAAQNQHQEKQTEGAHEAQGVSKTTAAIWGTMTGSVISIDKHITAVTSNLVKWASLTAAFSGLLGAGSLFGIDRLAATVASGRRASMGLGTSYGQRSAFLNNYERLINPSSLLSSVATGKFDFSSPQFQAMLKSGVSSQFISSHDTAQVAVEYMDKLRKLMKNVPRSQLGPYARAYGADQMMSPEDLRALTSASETEWKQMRERTLQDAKSQDVNDPAQKAWQDLVTQLDRAGRTIHSVFMEKLVAIEPGMEKLSDSFVKVIQAFADGPLIEQWITGLAGGLNKFADYVETPQFQDSVTNFVRWVGDAAESLWKFITSFSDYVPEVSGPGSGKAGAWNSGAGVSPYGDLNAASRAFGGAGSGATGRDARAYSVGTGTAGATPPVTGAGGGAQTWNGTTYPNTKEGHEAFIRDYASYAGVDPNFALAVAHAEGLRADIAPHGSPSDVDRYPNGQPFGWYDYQLNYRNGLGTMAARRGIAPGVPENWAKADAFSIDWMHSHGVGDWRGDRAVEAYRRSGRLSSVIVRPNVGGNPIISTYQTSNASAPPQ